MASIDDINWDYVLDSLKAQKCVLFLGVNAFKTEEGNDLETEMLKWLTGRDPNKEEIRHINQDGFLILKKKLYKRRVVEKIREFYNQSFPKVEEQLAKVARMPFSLIVTLTYDNLLQRVFESMSLEYKVDFYVKNKNAPLEFVPPSKDSPLIYNIMGNIEDPESLVLTHEDFFNYLESVFVAKSMHPELKNIIFGAERFIFLGLPYERWYFQMLLRTMKLHDKSLEEIERTEFSELYDPAVEVVYEEFRINFIPSGAEGFINKLYDHCSSAGMLKTIVNTDDISALPLLSLDEIKDLLGDARIFETMDYLRRYIREKGAVNSLGRELLLLRCKYNLLKNREFRGTIDNRDLKVEEAQVLEALLNLIIKAGEL